MDTPTSPTRYRLFVGGDIAAKTVTVAWHGADGSVRAPFSIEQSASGYDALRQRLLATGVAPQAVLVVMEATGAYWINLALTLHQAGFVVSVINPTQAHHFAKALLKRAKTDAIDAQTLAQLAARLQPKPWTPPPAIYAELQQRLAQRDALLGIRQQVRNQQHALAQQPQVVAAVQERMQALIDTLSEQIAGIEAELSELVRRRDPWVTTISLLMTIKGVGLLTAAWVVVTTLNFSVCSTPDEATAYAGLAPHPRTSGTSVRGRACIGRSGNARLRTALYLATLSAARTNTLITPFYQRLKAAGKAEKVARCASARKLLHIAWAVATKGQPFDPQRGCQQVTNPIST